MKRPVFGSLLAILLLPIAAFAGDNVMLQNTSGTVEYKPSKDATWTSAKKGSEIPAGGLVRTGADGRAQLKFKNRSTIWMKPATAVELQQKGPRNNQIILSMGSLKIRVPHLSRREKFDVKTPLAVASVRGTVFSVDAGGDSAQNGEKVHCYFGQVNYIEGNGKTLKIPQGMGFNGQSVALLSQMEEVLGLEDWTPGLADEQRRNGLVENVERRLEIREFSNQAMAAHKELVGSVSSELKTSDFAAGRTLTDVHGNLVRVEQRLDRPDDHTIQVTNVVVRKTYASGGVHKYAYNGVNSSRMDALIAKTEFNMALPEQINQFPGFFSANDGVVKVERASFVLANMGNANEIFAIGMFGKRNAASADDDVDADLYVGTLAGRSTLFNLALDGSGEVPGLTRFKEDTTMASRNTDAVNGDLHNTGAKRFVRNGVPGDYLWIATDNYVIDNGGRIRNVSDFTGGGSNIQQLIDNTAGETVVYAKKDDGSGMPDNSSTGDYGHSLFSGLNAFNPGNKNIDLVVIPDLAFSIVKSLASSGSSLNGSN